MGREIPSPEKFEYSSSLLMGGEAAHILLWSLLEQWQQSEQTYGLEAWATDAGCIDKSVRFNT